MRRWLVWPVAAAGLLALGCETTGHRSSTERFGKVYYLDGAGNLGYGWDSVPPALKDAGFRGDVEIVVWTTFTGPLGDQLIQANARLRSTILTDKITKYRKLYPDTPVYVIGLSAGTGVAVWAVENLPQGVKVDRMVLFGSSLSNDYDMTKCLSHVNEDVTVFYSPRDAVLRGFIGIVPTIDGKMLTEPAGLIGMRPPGGAGLTLRELYRAKIKNIMWRPSFESYGYMGGHTDGTSYRFVRLYVAPRVLGIQRGRPGAVEEESPATPPAERTRPDESPDPTALEKPRTPPEPSPTGAVD